MRSYAGADHNAPLIVGGKGSFARGVRLGRLICRKFNPFDSKLQDRNTKVNKLNLRFVSISWLVFASSFDVWPALGPLGMEVEDGPAFPVGR
jgi:hypothetical protein